MDSLEPSSASGDGASKTVLKNGADQRLQPLRCLTQRPDRMGFACRVAGILAILLGTSFAQNTSSLIQEDKLPEAPTRISTEAKIEFAAFAAEVAADGVSTRLLYQRGCSETDPVARPFVRAGVPGQVAATFLGLAAVAGAWAILHHTHHERMAKWMLRTAVAGEGANDIRQFRFVATQCR